VAKLHVFRAPKNSHVADVARLPFDEFFDSNRTNVLVQGYQPRRSDIFK